MDVTVKEIVSSNIITSCAVRNFKIYCAQEDGIYTYDIRDLSSKKISDTKNAKRLLFDGDGTLKYAVCDNIVTYFFDGSEKILNFTPSFTSICSNRYGILFVSVYNSIYKISSKKPSLVIQLNLSIDEMVFRNQNDGEVIIRCGNILHTVDINKLTSKQLFVSPAFITRIAISHDDRKVVVGSIAGTITVLIRKTRDSFLKIHNHNLGIISIAFNYNGTKIISLLSDCTTKIFNAHTGECIFIYTLMNYRPVSLFGSDKLVLFNSIHKSDKLFIVSTENITQNMKRKEIINLYLSMKNSNVFISNDLIDEFTRFHNAISQKIWDDTAILNCL